MENQKGLKHGIYKIYWISGGSSLAAIGFTHDGTNWFACCNWTSESNTAPSVASTKWAEVKSIELLIENNYDTESPSVQAGVEGNGVKEQLQDLFYSLDIPKQGKLPLHICEDFADEVLKLLSSTPAVSPVEEDAIAFAEWLQWSGWRKVLVERDNRWKHITEHFKTTSELYRIFKQENK